MLEVKWLDSICLHHKRLQNLLESFKFVNLQNRIYSYINKNDRSIYFRERIDKINDISIKERIDNDYVLKVRTNEIDDYYDLEDYDLEDGIFRFLTIFNLNPLVKFKNIENLLIRILTPDHSEDVYMKESDYNIDKDYFDLSEIKNLTNLKKLNLVDFNNNFQHIDILYSLDKLEELYLIKVKFDLGKIKFMKSLSKLMIYNNVDITDNLKCLGNALNLKILHIQYGILNNETIKNVSKCLNLEKLVFDLVEMDVNDNVIDLQPLMGLYSLKEIVIRVEKSASRINKTIFDSIIINKSFSLLYFENLREFYILGNNVKIENNYIKYFKDNNPLCNFVINKRNPEPGNYGLHPRGDRDGIFRETGRIMQLYQLYQ